MYIKTDIEKYIATYWQGFSPKGTIRRAFILTVYISVPLETYTTLVMEN